MNETQTKISIYIVDDDNNILSPELIANNTSEVSILADIVFNSGYNIIIKGKK